MRAALREYFPAALEAFDDLAAPDAPTTRPIDSCLAAKRRSASATIR